MKQFGLLLGMLLALGSCGTAKAEIGENSLAHNWGARLGFFVPERDSVRSATNDVWLNFGVDHTFYDNGMVKGVFSIDYYGSNGTYNIPFLFNAETEKNNWRMGAGLGINVGHDLDKGLTSMAYDLLVGYSISKGLNPINFDVRYIGTTRSNSQLNGWSFTLGIGF